MDFPYYPSEVPNYLIQSMMVGMIIGIVIALVFSFVFYIFNALGLYKISKNRGYKNAWIAFIPVANSYVLGAITDNINSCYMKKSNFRIWLLILNIITFILRIFNSVVLFGNISKIVQQSILSNNLPNSSLIGSIFLGSSLMGLASIIVLIITCICLYKIYSDYNPNNATLFLVLSILFGIAPFFIFAIRNKPSASLYFANQRVNQQQPQYQSQQSVSLPTLEPLQPSQTEPPVEPVSDIPPVDSDN